MSWQPCGEQFPGFECAVATVPLDYDRPRGATIGIALARKPAPNKANRIGSLYLNPGGPGGSGVNFALSAGNELSALLDGRFDIVGFDPRGIGRSDPLHCFTSVEERDAFFVGVPGFPYQTGRRCPRPAARRSTGTDQACPGCARMLTIATPMSTTAT